MKRNTVAIIILILLCLVFTSCVPDHYKEKQEKEAIANGKPLLEAYFAEVVPEGELSGFNMVTAALHDEYIYGGYYASHVVSCRCEYDGHSYTGYVNYETGEIWSNVYLNAFREAVAEIDPDCTIGYYDLQVITYSTDIVDSRHKKDRIVTDAYLQLVLPEGIDKSNVDEYAANYLKNRQEE